MPTAASMPTIMMTTISSMRVKALADDLACFGAGRGGKERARFRRRRRATPADPSAVAARWAATSVPARNKTRQPRNELSMSIGLNEDIPCLPSRD